MRRGLVELAGVGFSQAADVASELNAGRLHAEADAEVRHMAFARVADGVEHALDAALAEAARYKNAVEALKLLLVTAVFGLEAFGFEPGHTQLQVRVQRAMNEGFLQGLVTVFVLDVLAHDADVDLVFGVVGVIDQFAPLRHVGFFGVDVQVVQDKLVNVLCLKGERQFINVGDVARGDDGALFHVAEGGDLAAHLTGQVALAAAQQDVRLNADGKHLLDGVLRGLGLEFLRGGDPWDERDMHEQRVLAMKILPHLADGFEEGQRLNIANGAADLDDADIALGCDLAHRVLDLVGDVRDHLHSLAEVVAAALLRDDLLVDAAAGQVVIAREFGVGKALVVTHVQVGLGAVVGDKDLAMLKRRHGAGVDVQVRVKLHQVDANAARLKQAADGRGRKALPERRHNAARYKDVFR